MMLSISSLIRTFWHISFVCLTCFSLSLAAESWTPAPGHENLPVIFWAHYMPMVPHAHLHANHHIGGNADVYPFLSQEGSSADRMKKDMLTALDSGINGFQFLKLVPEEAFTAAAEVKRETGKNFYIAPEWCDLGPDPAVAADKIAGFIQKHRDEPSIFRIDGKQVHFLYNHGKWAGTGTISETDNLPAARKIIKEKSGSDVILIPTIYSFAPNLLDRPELQYKAFPPFVNIMPGEMKWMKETGWDGATALNGGANLRNFDVEAIKQRLTAKSGKFIIVPAVRTMYDSSNRSFQAIHCRGLGLRVLRNDLRLWIEAGFRFITFSTWNDVNETMLLPSSRNVWGYTELINYYHSLAATGMSPYNEARFIVAYEPEIMLGDEGFFQCLVLPERGCLSSDYAWNVTFRNIDGKEVYSGGGLMQTSNERRDDLSEFRFDTTCIQDREMVLTPYVSIRQIDKYSGASKMLYDQLRLAPIRVKYNKLHYYTPYAIALDHVNPEILPVLRFPGTDKQVITAKKGELVKLECQVKDSSLLQRLTLAESCLSLGAFRPDDLPGSQDKLFLRLSASSEIKAMLNLSSGKSIESYTNHPDLKKAVLPLNNAQAKVLIPATVMPVVIRLEAVPDTQISLRLSGQSGPVLNTTIRQLAENPFRGETVIDDKKITVDARLTTDNTDPNVFYPLPSGTYVRTIPLNRGHELFRVFHAWALDHNNRIAYSNPVGIIDAAAPESPSQVNFIRTYGAFDDFVDDSSSATRNPFTAANLVSRVIPSWMIPYVCIDFSEGCGKDVNHNGCAQQLGRGWIDDSCRWNKDSKGQSVLYVGNGNVTLRAKTFPHGSFTLLMRLKLDPEQNGDRILLEDGDNWNGGFNCPVSLTVNGKGYVTLRRILPPDISAVITAESPLLSGWNTITATCDLKTLTLFINGKPAGSAMLAIPGYRRTHSVPKIGGPFKGEISRLELIGTSLSLDEIARINEHQTWINNH